MPMLRVAVLLLAFGASTPALAWAQRFPFERTFATTETTKLDVSTLRGAIEIAGADVDRIVVAGTVTVRIGFDVPSNAVDLARRIAAAPPIKEQSGTLVIEPPAGSDERRAATVSYRIRVPRKTEVRTRSDSGATSLSGLSGSVSVQTQSAAIDLGDLAGMVTVSTGSGAVNAATMAGPLTVTTSSSAINATGLGASLRARTASGQVSAQFSGIGDADVETSSGSIRIRGLRGAVRGKTQSSAIVIDGAPRGPWTLSTGSGSVTLQVSESGPFSVDLTTGSGSIAIDGATVDGTVTKRTVKGRVRGEGPLVTVNSRSGSIRLQVAGK